ncbi:MULTISPECIES: helix-turn-helix transcriptional regulator [Clostridium]|mgnify:CR=1 FL=1|jgi:putative transcriptional regulator|uniref:helix-turn-helix transcriptional regulator n=1 Tax=Clostridium TaxID=1485 RepID=UPI000C074414|nr:MULTISPECIES: helix-turn-helix domain-containing protein [Clostridium]MBS4958919.1 helix-turn-helix domain-containing protein [Clostridium sp.]MBU6135991.1 helix-turn-helix domain-containing protein [Clostridium tertium]MDU7243285.1 helix-turn-helix domain-containing protein [Clostridium sp.]MDY4607031.1 helix-turn-helix domain-containing protein [Clostridium tertium]
MLKCRLQEIRLREFMIDNKTEFARKLNVPIQTYTNWEKSISYPNLTLAYEIAKKLNKEVTEIWYLE